MILSDLSIRRPVVCIVLTLLIVTVGLLSFTSLPVREYQIGRASCRERVLVVV